MPIISGGGGGGGLPTGWTQSGSPADVATNGGALSTTSGLDHATLYPTGLFVDGPTGFIEVDSGGLIFVAEKLDSGGAVFIGEAVDSAPTDLEVSAGQLSLWFDSTNGASKFMLKGKSANGTVVTAAVALA